MTKKPEALRLAECNHEERITMLACVKCGVLVGTQPMTDEDIWKFWWSRPEVPDGEDDSMEAEFVAAVRRVLAAHGIKGEA